MVDQSRKLLESGDLHLLESGGEHLLERTRRNLYWHNLSGDGELSNRANYAQDSAGVTPVVAVPTDSTVPARDGYRYYRLITDNGTSGGNLVVNQIDLWDLEAGANVWAAMSDNTTPAPQVASASSNNANAWLAFDGDTGTGWDSGTSAGGSWVKIDMGAQTPARLVRVWFSTTASEQPRDWWIEGSNDDVSWTRLAGQAIPSLTAGTTPFKALLNPEQQLIAYQGQVLDQIDADSEAWYWTFDDGTAEDLSLNGLDGTLNGTFTASPPLIARAGGSVIPQNPGDYIQGPTGGDLTSSFFSCWVQKPDDTVRRLLFGRGTAAGGGHVLYLETDGTLRSGAWEGGDSVFVQAACSSDQTHHVATLFTAGALYLFIDGQLVAVNNNEALNQTITLGGGNDVVAGSDRSLLYHDGASALAYTAVDTRIDEAFAARLALWGPDNGSLWLAGLGYQNQIYADSLIFDDTVGGGAADIATSTAYVPAYSLQIDSAVQDQLVLSGGSRMDVERLEYLGGHQQPLDLTSSGDLTVWQVIEVSGQPLASTTVLDTSGTLQLAGSIEATGGGSLVEIRGPATAIGSLMIGGTVDVRLANAVTDNSLGFELLSSRTDGETQLDEEVLFEYVVNRQGVMVYEQTSASASGPAASGEVEVPADGVGTPDFTISLQTAVAHEYTGSYVCYHSDCELSIRDPAGGGTLEFSGDFEWRRAGGSGTLFLDSPAVDGLFDEFTGDLLDVALTGFDISKQSGRTLFFSPTATHQHQTTFIDEGGVGDGSLQGIGLKWDAPGTGGVKTRGFGDVILSTSSETGGTFQLRHFLGGDANRVEFTTPIISYGVPLWLALGPISGTNPTYTKLQQLAIGGTVTVDYGAALGTAINTIGILEVAQDVAYTPVLTLDGDGAVDARLVIDGTLRDESVYAPGTAGNDLNLELLSATPASQIIRFDGVSGPAFTQGVVRILETQSEWVEFSGTVNINTDLENDLGQVRLVAGASLTVANYYQPAIGTAFEAQVGAVFSGSIFQLAAGTFSVAAGATWNVLYWRSDNVDAVGAAPWFVNATVQAYINGASLQNSDASGGVTGEIRAGATDLGGNINWGGVPTISSPHLWYPDGYPGRVFDLRWVGSWAKVGSRVFVRMFGNPASVLEFSAAQFEPAWLVSRLNDPALPGDPAITGMGPQFQVGNTVYNGTMIEMWAPHPTDSTKLLIWVSSMSAEDDGGVPMNQQVEVDKAEFEFQIGTNYPWWSPDGQAYYNLDRIVCWNTSEPVPTRFDSPQRNTLFPDLLDFQFNMENSKGR